MVQGYWLSKPLPAEQCLAFMLEWPGLPGLAPRATAADARYPAP